ncbi:MAG: DUF983 domain-containing protein [Alphaproteobacteria bacterium]|nr:DUF983 domain-containing protein [Alphaproteobacteria bacterium]
MFPDPDMFKLALACKCPRCREGDLYKPGFTLDLRDVCPACGLDYSKGDAADGPAVFLIFVLGFLLVPLALWLEFSVHPPLWVHAALWGALALGLTLGLLRPLKAYILALQFKHRARDFE